MTVGIWQGKIGATSPLCGLCSAIPDDEFGFGLPQRPDFGGAFATPLLLALFQLFKGSHQKCYCAWHE
jgi:hypothetical protein